VGGQAGQPGSGDGRVSLIIWALVIVSHQIRRLIHARRQQWAKAAVMALAALAHRSPVSRAPKTAIGVRRPDGPGADSIGDGMLTPAISVLSGRASKGLAVSEFLQGLDPLPHHPDHSRSCLFLVPEIAGTRKVWARLFGPVRWRFGFVLLAVHGPRPIAIRAHAATILYAADPRYALRLFIHEPWTAFLSRWDPSMLAVNRAARRFYA